MCPDPSFITGEIDKMGLDSAKTGSGICYNRAFHVDKTEQKPVLGWPKTGSMIDENRFNGEFKISPWRNFVNRNKLFCYVAPNHSEELENTVCHQR